MTEGRELKKITSSMTLIGTCQILMLICQFLTGILVIRIITPEEFGLLSLGLTLIGIFVVIINFGMGMGLPRTISKQMASPESNSNVGQTITSSVLFTLFLGLFCTLILFIGADKISQILNKDGLAVVLKVLSLTVLPIAFITVFGAIFRGLEFTKPAVLFQNISLNVTKILLVIIVFLTGLRFKGILAVYTIAAGLTFGLFAIYVVIKLKNSFEFSFSVHNAKELIFFSSPLLGVQLLQQLIVWVTTLFLGYYHSADAVGLYSAPFRLVLLLSMPLEAVVYIYLPIATRSITAKEDFDISSLYTTVTKWLAVFTLPMSLIMVFDSKFLVTTLFAERYSDAALILVVLTIGYSIHALLGPNGMTLIAFGNRRAMLISTVLGGGASSLISLILIPRFGAFGAAVAVCIGVVLSKLYLSYSLYKISRINPFRMDIFKPMSLILMVAASLFFIINFFNNTSIILHLSAYLFLAILALFAPYITQSITSDERTLMNELKSSPKIPSWV